MININNSNDISQKVFNGMSQVRFKLLGAEITERDSGASYHFFFIHFKSCSGHNFSSLPALAPIHSTSVFLYHVFFKSLNFLY